MGRAMCSFRALPFLLLAAAAACGGPEANPKSTDAYERYLGVAEQLGTRPDAAGMADLVGLLNDPHYLVVVGVLEVLESIGDPAFLQHAATGLQHKHPMVRHYACRLIATLRQPDGAALLAGVLKKDPEPSVRRAAIKGLVRYGKDPVILAPLVEAVGDKDLSVSVCAHEALETLTEKKGVGRRTEEWRKAAAP